MSAFSLSSAGRVKIRMVSVNKVNRDIEKRRILLRTEQCIRLHKCHCVRTPRIRLTAPLMVQIMCKDPDQR